MLKIILLIVYLLCIITAVQNEPEQLRPFHLVEHGRVVVIGVVLVWTPLVVGFGTDLPVVVDDDLPVADLALPAAGQSAQVISSETHYFLT